MKQPIYFMYELGNDVVIQETSTKITEDIFKVKTITN